MGFDKDLEFNERWTREARGVFSSPAARCSSAPRTTSSLARVRALEPRISQTRQSSTTNRVS